MYIYNEKINQHGKSRHHKIRMTLAYKQRRWHMIKASVKPKVLFIMCPPFSMYFEETFSLFIGSILNFIPIFTKNQICFYFPKSRRNKFMKGSLIKEKEICVLLMKIVAVMSLLTMRGRCFWKHSPKNSSKWYT